MTKLCWRACLRAVLLLLGCGLLNGGYAATRTAASLGGTAVGLPNGTFEAPALATAPGYQYGPAGTGWTLTGGAGLSRNGTAFTSGNPSTPQGAQVLFLQTTASASQSLNFVAGYYTFSFFAAQRGNMPNNQTIELKVDGALVQAFTPAGATYQSLTSVAVLLSSGPHTVELRGTNPLGGDNTAFVDDVKVTRVKAQLISGFELPALPVSPGFAYTPAGGPWTFGGGTGLSRNGSGFTASNPACPEGSQAMFLQGGGATASISVSIPYSGYYRFRFQGALRGANPTQPAAKNIRLLIGGNVVGEFPLTSTSYVEKVSLAIYLTAGTQTLSITGVDPLPGDHTGLVDNLRMEMLHDWQDPYVWGGAVPSLSDDANIDMGSTVCLQGTVNAQTIMVMGELVGVQNQNMNVTTKNIMVMGTGALLELGQDLVPYPGSAIFTLNATTADPNVMGMGNKFIGAMDFATIHFHGKDKISWSQLAANVNAGSNTIALKEAVNWQVGDQIVIVSSRTNWNEAEKRSITSISGNTLTLNTALSYPHKGVVQTYTQGAKTWTADLRAQVGVLSHNIKVQGDAASSTNGFGGHMMIMDNSWAYIGGVELYNMGQKAILGRYPFHWHMLGSVGAGQYFKNSSIHQSYNRAITIHGTESTLVENNFFYDHIGHGVFLEDGSERFNVIRKNVTLLTKRPAVGEQVTPSDNQLNEVQNRTPGSYWITNPQNTFEDNVAAGTEGTGYWFLFPQHPMGLSATDPRFSAMQPHTLPMISFKGNSAHSTMNAFDIFDQLDANHAIVTNLGWTQSSPHVMENCTWYANDLALYTGIGAGGPSDNLIFRNNAFVENNVAIMFASYSIVDQSVIVANSGQSLSTAPLYAYRVYDGAGQVQNSHFIGWDAANTSFLLNTGAAIKHPNHMFTNNTTFPTTSMRCILEDFDIKPTVAHANHPGHPRYWSIVLRDVTGGISGKANTSIVSNQPFMLVGDEFQPSNWTRTYRSDHRFVLSRLSYNVSFPATPNITCTREKAGTASESVYYIDGYKEWHQLPFIANEGYEYTYTYEALPSVKSVVMNMEDATVGDNYVARFKDFGKLGGLTLSSSQGALTSHASLGNLRSAATSGYFLQVNGDLYIKAVATGKYQTFSLNWTTDFTVPALDTDGDQMPDAAEITATRDAFDASDLATHFNTAAVLEDWGAFANITSPTVSGGLFSCTSNGNGDAQMINSAYNFNSDRVPHLFVRMKASQNTPAQIFFASSTMPGFSGTRVVTANYTGNGAYQTLIFNMNAHADWANVITDLRLDPVSGAGITMEIDWIQAPCQDVDNDGDGICNFADLCPSLNDRLIGTSCNDGNPATFPDAWSATTCSCTAGTFKTAEVISALPAVHSADAEVTVYPNPFQGELHIQFRNPARYNTLRVTDLQGRILRESTIAADAMGLDLDLAPLASGIYVLEFIGHGLRTQVKVMRD